SRGHTKARETKRRSIGAGGRLSTRDRRAMSPFGARNAPTPTLQTLRTVRFVRFVQSVLPGTKPTCELEDDFGPRPTRGRGRGADHAAACAGVGVGSAAR